MQSARFHPCACLSWLWDHWWTNPPRKESLLKERKEDNEIGGYLDVHLPTCVNAIEEGRLEVSNYSPCHAGIITRRNYTPIYHHAWRGRRVRSLRYCGMDCSPGGRDAFLDYKIPGSLQYMPQFLKGFLRSLISI